MRIKTIFTVFALLVSVFASATVSIREVGGWFESGYATFTKDGSKSYNVYYKAEGAADDAYQRVDGPLVRDYGDYARVDVLGIKAGKYKFKIVPVGEDNTEKVNEAVESNSFTAIAHDRGGFAHLNYTKGVGAYKDDGTLKADAKVVYITAGNAKTVTCELGGTTFTGFQGIVNGCNGKYGNTPVAIRIIGMVKLDNMDAIGSSSEGLQIKGKGSYTEMNLTVEGVGNDAVLHGFGVLIRNSSSIELRNFAVMNCMDDCISLDTDNNNVWVHNIDFFYGNDKGGDQAKGDGSLDVKGDSKYITFSYNHFWDSGKSSLCGMKSESGPNYITYHHNWFDHSDSRHPRVRTMTVHVYNNYFDGNAKYGVGATTGSSVFVESNYYRNTNKPMMISKQGTDIAVDPKGTFSGEDGGMIKSCGNVFKDCSKLRYVTYQENNVEFDAYEVTDRNMQVPASVKAKQGGGVYNNFDTNSSLMYSYTPHVADNVPSVLKGEYGAGRMQHGDFEFTFNNATDDASYSINTDLKNKMLAYTSSLVGIIGDNTVQGGGTGGGEIGGGDIGGGTGGGDIPEDGDYSCYFTKAGPSNSFYKITGNYSNSKGTATVNGTTYEYCLKLESSTKINFTTEEDMTLTLVFESKETPSIKIDGDKKTSSGSNVYTYDLSAGSHELTKADTRNLFYINLSPKGGSTIVAPVCEAEQEDGPIYDLSGRVVKNPQKGIYIQNGKKIVIR